jgi:hypothetical protein
MKCIQMSDQTVRRVSDKLAERAVVQGAKYVKKEVWKKAGRGRSTIEM